MSKWHENDKFWEVMAPKLFGSERLAETQQEIDQIISLLEISPGSKVLDLCCGQGRHSLELARRGFITTGVDRTLKYLEKAKNEANEQNLSIDFIKDDMRHFKRLDYFNTIITMYTSFGYFEDHKDNMLVLHNCYYSLEDNGLLLNDLMGKEVVARIFCERESYQLDGSTYIEVRKVSKDWSWMENRWIKQKGKSRQEFKLSHWLYSANELSIMLNEVGFRSTKFFGNLRGDPYDNTAQRLIAIARK